MGGWRCAGGPGRPPMTGAQPWEFVAVGLQLEIVLHGTDISTWRRNALVNTKKSAALVLTRMKNGDRSESSFSCCSWTLLLTVWSMIASALKNLVSEYWSAVELFCWELSIIECLKVVTDSCRELLTIHKEFVYSKKINIYNYLI